MAVAAAAGVVVVLFMALPFFVESAPRAYRLKAGNAAPSYFNIPRDIPIKLQVPAGLAKALFSRLAGGDDRKQSRAQVTHR